MPALPAIWPSDAAHREHMESWCNGTNLRDGTNLRGGIGPGPNTGGYLHRQHMVGYCAAKAAVHSMASELWAGPPYVFAALAMLMICFCCCFCCRWCCVPIRQKQKLSWQLRRMN